MTRNHTLLALLAAGLLGLAACDGTSPRGVVDMEPMTFDALVVDILSDPARTNETDLPVTVNNLNFDFLAQGNDDPTLQDQI